MKRVLLWIPLAERWRKETEPAGRSSEARAAGTFAWKIVVVVVVGVGGGGGD